MQYRISKYKATDRAVLALFMLNNLKTHSLTLLDLHTQNTTHYIPHLISIVRDLVTDTWKMFCYSGLGKGIAILILTHNQTHLRMQIELLTITRKEDKRRH